MPYRGLLNRKLPSVTVPDALEYVLDDFTIKGESIYTFIEQLEVELITTNRVGVFVDYPYVDPDRLSKAGYGSYEYESICHHVSCREYHKLGRDKNK